MGRVRARSPLGRNWEHWQHPQRRWWWQGEDIGPSATPEAHPGLSGGSCSEELPPHKPWDAPQGTGQPLGVVSTAGFGCAWWQQELCPCL